MLRLVTLSSISLVLFSACRTSACPTPVEPVTPPPRIVQLQPPPCAFPEPPAPVDLTGIVGTALAGIAGVFSPDVVWRAILERDLAWQSAWKLAKLCERPANNEGAKP